MECRGAQRYDLYRVVLQKPKNLIETREKILVSSHETESECKTAAGGSAGFRVEDLTELGKSKSAISQLQCFAVDEFSRT